MATWTQADIDKVKAIIANGAKSVRTGDESVENYDLAALLDLLKEMEAAVSGVTTRRTLANFSKGFK